jgi:Fic family protein
MEVATTSPGRVVPTIDRELAYVPNPLPPPLSWDDELVLRVAGASAALGNINGKGSELPNPRLLFLPYLSREAVASSRLEGTISSVADVLRAGAEPREPTSADTAEVVNYLRAMEWGLTQIRSIPLHWNLILDLHRRLLEGTRGQFKSPGRVRTTQSWLGDRPDDPLTRATYVPPPPAEVDQCVRQWETYLHAAEALPRVVQCALLHYQLEAIHPFNDGNGRVGRLVNTLYLVQHGTLTFPMLNLSEYFERDGDRYRGGLRRVTEDGDWMSWVKYFLEGVEVQANAAVRDCERLINLRKQLAARVPKGKTTAARAIDLICAYPYISATQLAERLMVTHKAATDALHLLEECGVVAEVTGHRRNRMWEAKEVIEGLEGIGSGE